MEKMSIQKIQKDLNKIWKEWKVKRLIGEGSFGKVYQIERRDEFGHRYEAALKVITVPQSQAEVKSILHDGMDIYSVKNYFHGIVEDIIEEFALMSKLKGNSNIVSYEDHAVVPYENAIGWNLYIRMELLTPLFDYLKYEKFSVKKVIQLGIDMCRALEICEQYHIIHRDIKPENIFVSKLGRFKLGDFGIAKQMEKTSLILSKKGTYTYMAPEVYKGKPYNATVDIYSLGIVLYWFLNNNRTPFLPEYPKTIGHMDKERANRIRMSGMAIKAPCHANEGLAKIVLKACAYEEEKRYQHAGEMRKDLEKILEKGTSTPKQDNEILSMDVSEYEMRKKESETRRSLEEKLEETVYLFREETNMEEDTAQNLFVHLVDPKERKRLPMWKEKIKTHRRMTGIFLFCVVLLGIGIYLVFSKTRVPEFKNMTVIQAQKEASRESVKVKVIKKEFSDKVPQGRIISQNLQEGKIVKNGTSVEIVISRGKEIIVPNLYKKTQKEAKKILAEKGLQLEVAKEQFSDVVKKGCIILQTPKADRVTEAKTKISVVISKGIEQVKVPFVEGKQKENAVKAVKKARLKYEISYAYSNVVSQGRVISQSVVSGKWVDKNSVITLVISQGERPEPVVVTPQTPNTDSGNDSDAPPQNNKKPADNDEDQSDWGIVN